jgi:hypothetical protein
MEETKMDLRLVGAAVVLLSSMASFAWAGDEAQPVSPATLEAMGFGRMQALSETDGARVRGKFTFAFVRGSSTAGGMTRSYFDFGANHASGFRGVVAPSGGGSFGFAFGGASAWAN